jgi:hypothetical protein
MITALAVIALAAVIAGAWRRVDPDNDRTDATDDMEQL